MTQETNREAALADIDWPQLALRAQAAWGAFMQRQMQDPAMAGGVMASLTRSAVQWAQSLASDPGALVRAQGAWLEGQAALWQSALSGATETAAPDRRFRHPDWRQNPFFAQLQSAYAWTVRALTENPAQLEGLDPATRKRVEFYLRQTADALSPTNSPLLNPEVLHAIVATGGQNLVRGFERMLADLERGGGNLRLRMTDENAFTLGKNIATSPGKVVFQNGVMQLIQYTPATATVNRRPLLVIPPWINKFYIMDLRPENSLVRWWVEQGHTVFMISWINPDARYRDMRFDDYMTYGTLAALDAIAAITGEPDANAVGYCIGGTLLACTLAYLRAHDQPRVRCATFYASLLEFSEPGDLGIFIDEPVLAALEAKMARDGVLDGADMAAAFNLLRANDLIWNFFVMEYLLDKDPPAFDLLYWNSDSTRMPAAMHGWYLRELYQRNRLREPQAIILNETPIDLGRVGVPTYWVSTSEDHIAPWRSVYRSARLLGGPVRFVRAGSGHIAGIINPPAARKYQFQTAPRMLADPDAWLERATTTPGSWWDDWASWVKRHRGDQVPARTPGETAGHPALEDAPGSYVRQR